MANLVYNHFKMHVLSGDIDLSTVPVYVALCGGSYTFSHTHEFLSDISDEVVSAGYIAGGQLVPNTTTLVDSVDDEAVLSGDAMTYSGITATVEYGLVWVSGGSPTTNLLLGQIDFGSQTLSNSDFVLTWNTEGIYNLM
tara:strand:+ start:68982 stop:69398 length:417 start_codon:yes stop_codon:yes gene_type:complete